MTVHPTLPIRHPHRAWSLVMVSVVAGVAMAWPYAGLDSGASRLPVSGGLHYGLLVAHVATALVALVLGPLQFVPAVRARRSVHRVLGRTYLLLGVVPAALTGIPVALLSGRLVTQVGLAIPAVLWLVTGTLAVRAIRRGDVGAHRSWMLRNYALTFLAVTARLLVPAMVLLGAALGAPVDLGGAIPRGQVLGWIVNLAVVEVLIRRRARGGRRRRLRPARAR